MKKIFALCLALSVIVLQIQPSHAALIAGDLVKGPNSDAVYYLNGFSKYVFPDGKTFMSWFQNFDQVKSVSIAELDEYPTGVPMTYRAGTKLITHPNTARVYAVGANNALHWIPSEACATALYGPIWAERVQDVHEATFSSYGISADVDCEHHARGALLQKKGEATVYYVGAPIQTSPGQGSVPVFTEEELDAPYQIHPFASDVEFILSGLKRDNIIMVESLGQYELSSSIKGSDIKDILTSKIMSLTSDQSEASQICSALGGVPRLEFSLLDGEERIFCSFGVSGECTQNELNSSTCFKQS
jgi:hypothetical protein